jgi:hypothetical protein
MLGFIKNYFQRAKEEAAQEYVMGSAHESRPSDLVRQVDKPWVGVDLDGTLAVHEDLMRLDRVGAPIPATMDLVRKMINDGIRVKIFTARASDPTQLTIIRKWLAANDLPPLEITNVKDYMMSRLYDDRCIQVEKNTGRLIGDN